MKTLNEDVLRDELAGSTFFRANQPANEPTPVQSQPAPEQPGKPARSHDAATPRAHDTVTPSEEVIETIRKAVKQLGKEDATYRFTDVEKKALADVVYTYSRAGVRTSQNEITRIGINYVMEDYRSAGKYSVLARVLERLNE